MEVVVERNAVREYGVAAPSDRVLWVLQQVPTHHGIIVIRERSAKDGCSSAADIIKRDSSCSFPLVVASANVYLGTYHFPELHKQLRAGAAVADPLTQPPFRKYERIHCQRDRYPGQGSIRTFHWSGHCQLA